MEHVVRIVRRMAETPAHLRKASTGWGSTVSERVVIIGASHAGVAVVETLRRKGFRGKLTLISEEKLPLYSPTTLPYLLMGRIGSSSSFAHRLFSRVSR